MAHVTKMTRAVVGHMFKHYERAKDESGEYLKFSNQDIDSTLSHLNYNLAPARGISQGDFIKQRCSEVYCLSRKDVNVACSWIVTIPKDFLELNQDKKVQDFFHGAYSFLEKRYGKANVVSAYVHMDETTPHLHFCFVPVVADKKKGFKVSAKECVNKRDLQTFHENLREYLLQEHGLCCNVINQATIDGNKSIEELKKQTAVERLQNALKEVENAKAELIPIEQRKTALNDEIERLEGKILSLQEVNSINVKKTLTGALKGITYEEIINLKKTAAFVNAAKDDLLLVEKKSFELAQARKLLAEEKEELKRLPLEQQIERVTLENRMRKAENMIVNINKTLELLPIDIQKRFMHTYKSLETPQHRNMEQDMEFER